MNASPDRGMRAPVLVACAATLAVRALVAMSRADEVELEVYSGSIAEALLAGMPLDLEQLPVISHARGSVVLGVLAAPLFALLGPRLLALKLLALALGTAKVGLLTALIARAAGRSAAWFAAGLLALLPPAFQMVDVIALGSHADSLLFTLGGLWLLAAPDRHARRGPLSWRRALAAGALAGCGVFFSLQCALALPALALAWGLADRRFALRPASWLFPLAAAACAAPMLLFMGGGQATAVVGRDLEERFDLGGLAAKLGALMASDLRRAWLFEHFGGAWAGWLYAAALVAALALVWPRLARGEPLPWFLIAYPLLVLVVYSATDFQLNLDTWQDGMGSRYFMPVVPCLAALIAIAAGDLVHSPWIPAGYALAGAALAAGAAGLAPLLRPWVGIEQPPVRGAQIYNFHGQIEHAAGDDLAARLTWVERLDSDWTELRPLAYDATFLARREWPDQAAFRVDLAALADCPAPVRPYAAAALGYAGLAASAGRKPIESLEQILALAGELDGELRPWFLRGAGRAWTLVIVQARPRGGRENDGSREGASAPLVAAIRRVPDAARADFLAGLGFQLGFRMTPYEPALLEAAAELAVLPEEWLERIFEGAGRGYRFRFLEERYAIPARLQVEPLLPAGARAAFRRGLDPASAF
jgi:hypothetical protein